MKFLPDRSHLAPLLLLFQWEPGSRGLPWDEESAHSRGEEEEEEEKEGYLGKQRIFRSRRGYQEEEEKEEGCPGKGGISRRRRDNQKLGGGDLQEEQGSSGGGAGISRGILYFVGVQTIQTCWRWRSGFPGKEEQDRPPVVGGGTTPSPLPQWPRRRPILRFSTQYVPATRVLALSLGAFC